MCIYNLFYFVWLCGIFGTVHVISLVGESGDYSLLVMRGLLLAVAPLVVEL